MFLETTIWNDIIEETELGNILPEDNEGFVKNTGESKKDYEIIPGTSDIVRGKTCTEEYDWSTHPQVVREKQEKLKEKKEVISRKIAYLMDQK